MVVQDDKFQFIEILLNRSCRNDTKCRFHALLILRIMDMISGMTGENFSRKYMIRRLSEEERQAALDLAWAVFSEYESPDYSAEGTEEFRKCLHDEEYLRGLQYYGAFDGGKLIGEIAIRPEKLHICFFFVDGRYHRLGIGTKMFRRLLEDYPGETITLNSSPYGLPFYKAIGFVPTDEEKIVNGIRFTPMKYDCK